MTTTKAPPYTMTAESITVVWEGKSYTVNEKAPNFVNLQLALIQKKWDEVPNHLSIKKSVTSWSKGNFVIGEDSVKYKGKEVPHSFGERIMTMVTEGKDPNILFNFWEKLQKNPSWRSVQQLWTFLAHANIPLTPDGCFLAYKAVTSDYKDVHTNTVDNKPGVTNEMPRNEISDDPSQACHYGFHVGALGYARTFHTTGRMIVCKVDPENVVCVPHDHSQEKMRVCKYVVVGNYGEALPSSIYEDTLPAGNDNIGAPVKDEYEEPEDDENSDDLEDDEPVGEVSQPDPDSPEDSEDVEDEEDAMEDGAGIPYKETKTPPPPKAEKKAAKEEEKTVPSKADFKAFDKMKERDLLNESIEALRRYVTYGLEIVGASKVPGGKVALVKVILKARR